MEAPAKYSIFRCLRRLGYQESSSHWGCDMLVEEASRIIDEYARWVKKSMVPVQQGDAVQIITPMLNRNNDCMSVLLGESPEGGYIVTDLGETIADLELSGVRLSSDKRLETLDQFVRGYGVYRGCENELFIRCSAEELVPKLNMLMQAMASVDHRPSYEYWRGFERS